MCTAASWLSWVWTGGRWEPARGRLVEVFLRTTRGELGERLFIDPHVALSTPSRTMSSHQLLVQPTGYDDQAPPNNRDALLFLLPLLIVLSTFLFLILLFLVFVILLRKRRGIHLRDGDGPIDLSREDLIEGEGGFDGVESRWLESVSENERRVYLRAKGVCTNQSLGSTNSCTEYQLQYPPNSLPTDITLSQFLSIQEKGVSAWSFEPDFEAIHSLLVHARTEITFLPDPSSASSVQSNLPLPKLNDVYYWEVKMFDLPLTTNVAVGLATKPYPSFRLPGHSRFSIAYHSNGDKSFNYPFTSQTFGVSLKEGDVLGIGFRPRAGTVFYTRNGRKMDDAFTGLMNYNLFPTVGADGPCSVHVNLGQAGFVFIEANVKKWGLAPSVGTLAPPPAYGSERGSILLAAGGELRPANGAASPRSASTRRSHRSRRPKRTAFSPPESSPLSATPLNSPPPLTPPPPITPIEEESESSAAGPSSSGRYISPTDLPFHTPAHNNLPPSPPSDDSGEGHFSESSRSRSPSAGANPFNTPRHLPVAHSRGGSLSGPVLAHPIRDPPESPLSPNPPTPNIRDIHLRALAASNNGVPEDILEETDAPLSREPPAYSPLDAFQYADGVQIDLPADVISAALETGTISSDMINRSRSETHRGRRNR